MNNKSKKVYIKSYGCQMNVYDSERMADILRPLGYVLTEDPAQADLAILNTCHVREKAAQKMYSDAGRLKLLRDERRKDGKDMLISVGGCVAQAEGGEIVRQAPHVDMVFGPQTYHRLPEMIAQAERARDQRIGPGRGVIDVEFPSEPKFDSLPKATESKSSMFVSIQEGCDKFCHFCVVPYTRGAEYSRPVQDIIEDLKNLTALGAKEITLLGQNVNAYHGTPASGQGEWNFGQLLYEIADKIPSLPRLRYTTSHPRDVHPEQITAHRDIMMLMPYLHLPIQSGSDTILHLMNRKHTGAEYLDIIAQLKEAQPDLALSSDFIVGFPGETDLHFQETLAMIRAVGYIQAYSFKYSIRPGTPAGAADLQVPEEKKSERLAQLQALLNEQQLTFNQSLIGTIQEVLLDREGKYAGQMIGRSPYMQSVHVFSGSESMGQLVKVRVTDAHANSLTGVLIDEEGRAKMGSGMDLVHNERVRV